jgi:hypothetical protein
MSLWVSKIIPGGGRGWMFLHFIDWWRVPSEVTCQPFPESHGLGKISFNINVDIKFSAHDAFLE